MASVISLGVHKPSAIPFLIAEGILPAHPSEDMYAWETIADFCSENETYEEELLTTKHCVVWSRGGTIQRTFRLDVEGETVTKALFANFPFRAQHGVSAIRLRKTGHAEEGNGQSDHLELPKHTKLRSRSNITDDGKGECKPDPHFDEEPSKRRALVIVLKTQAHVYFLSETSHIVHLPFEVETVYPLPRGILLQRKVRNKDAIVATPQIPSAPDNTFVFSQSSISSLSDRDVGLSTPNSDISSPFFPMLQDLIQFSKRRSKTPPPRLVCLIDPLNEIGEVVTRNFTRSRHSYVQRDSSAPSFTSLDPEENLICVSPQDGLGQSASPREAPLTIAVTQNDVSGNISLWTVSYLDQQKPKSTRQRPSGLSSGSFSRRKSSFGADTGASTPRVRGNGLVRESATISMSQDLTLEENYDRSAPTILDSAFEDPMEPAKSSRRVSSLLARADLAASNDRISFSDSKGGHGKRSCRRGGSFGPNSSQISTGVEKTAVIKGPKPLNDIRSSMGSVTLSDSHSRWNMEERPDLAHQNTINQDPPMPYGLNDGLRKEVQFRKIYCTQSEVSHPPQFRAHKSHRIQKAFVVNSPRNCIGSSTTTALTTIFIVTRSTSDMLILQIEARRPRHTHKGDPATVNNSSQLRNNFRVSEVRKSGVLDVCRFGDGIYRRVVTLSEGSDGTQVISLQTPWGSMRNIQLPSPLNLYSPFQINGDNSLQQRREGGRRRVLSGGPQALVSLPNESLQGSFDVVDSGSSRHRISLQLRPRDLFVTRIIRVCEAILPVSLTQREVILRAWWDAASWLKSRQEEDIDVEWTAMIVVLFSMATPFIPDRRADVARQQKRRKGGLLRSSSGANTDLGSWETMTAQEHDFTSTTPIWMVQGPWKWTKNEEGPSNPSLAKRSRSSASQRSLASVPIASISSHMLHCISLSHEFTRSSAGQFAAGQQGCLPTSASWDPEIRRTALASILIALHLLCEEYKLDVLAAEQVHKITPVLAQIGGWLGWQNWSFRDGSFYMKDSVDVEYWQFDDSVITSLIVPPEPFPPPSIFQYIESTGQDIGTPSFVSLLDVASPSEEDLKDKSFIESSRKKMLDLTPRTMLITHLLAQQSKESMEARITKMASRGLTASIVETLPEGVAVSFRTALTTCLRRPSTAWSREVLEMIGRYDLTMLEGEEQTLRGHGRPVTAPSNEASRDVHSVCHTAFEVETLGPYDGSAENDRQSITRLLFKEDQRFAEAAKLVHPLLYPMARCACEPEWSDTDLLEAQQELVKIIAMRTLSVSLGRGLIFYSARLPVLTEKFPIHGFTLSCVMKPGDTTVTADRTSYTEEKVSWAFFHAGVEAGLSISKEAKGVNTSWILFNKPRDLNNRHAGFLFAMGLNGHLKSIAKWVAFKYLTPKHSMTSVGLLLGLSASHLGTMDTLVTRLLSVHVTRMLPPGAAELNLSPLTQTSGVMGIGLLYYNTQHRRMSEIMLSEIENVEEEDSSNPLDSLRDEGYRLAAGFALGYINLGRGRDLKGLHDMQIAERLLALAVAVKRGDRVHVLDRATAGATIATALIFMKSQDGALARKIDIPDTPHQFEYVRPDHFLLRTVAKHIIMWDDIRATADWMKQQLPLGLQKHSDLTSIRLLTSEDLPLLNIIAGLCFAIGLRYAGSGLAAVRDLLCHYLNHFMRICRLTTLNYDGKLARITVRNCQDLVALSAACVMAGTGDIQVFRRLRSLHGRIDDETPYGSHLATHFAIGVLFLGGGSHTFGTSNLAVASLLCAFYPLFPTTVLDNKSHLQAFRHFWVLAIERRCLVARDVDTQRPISLPILVTLKDSGTQRAMIAPCLLPELHTISQIQSNDPEYWRVTLDLLHNPKHLDAFRRHQSIYLRRRAPYDAHTSVFSATMQAFNDSLTTHALSHQPLTWIFSLSAFRRFDRAERAMVLPNDPGESVYRGTRGTVLDDRLVLETASLGTGKSERLWSLRLLLAWADWWRLRGEGARDGDGDGKAWIGREVVERLRAAVVLWRQERLAA